MNNAMIAIIETWLGHGDAALRGSARTGAVARELRHRLAEAMNEEVTGWMLVLHGRHEEAEPHLSAASRSAREIGARRYETMYLMLLARVDWERGERRKRGEHLRESWRCRSRSGTDSSARPCRARWR